MMRLVPLLVLLSCARGPAAPNLGGFAAQPPPWCVDAEYVNNHKPAIVRVCVGYPGHCEKVRKGLLRYGNMADVVAVSRCFR